MVCSDCACPCDLGNRPPPNVDVKRGSQRAGAAAWTASGAPRALLERPDGTVRGSPGALRPEWARDCPCPHSARARRRGLIPGKLDRPTTRRRAPVWAARGAPTWTGSPGESGRSGRHHDAVEASHHVPSWARTPNTFGHTLVQCRPLPMLLPAARRTEFEGRARNAVALPTWGGGSAGSGGNHRATIRLAVRSGAASRHEADSCSLWFSARKDSVSSWSCRTWCSSAVISRFSPGSMRSRSPAER